MLHTKIVLSIDQEAKVFYDELKGMPYLQETYEHIVKDIVEYLSDTEYGPGNLLEYITESIEMHECVDLDGFQFNAERHRQVLQRLGNFLYREMQRHKLYDSKGVLWYQVIGFLGPDVILGSMNEEDFIN